MSVVIPGRKGSFKVIKDDGRTVLVRGNNLTFWVSRSKVYIPAPAFFWLGLEGEQR